jgi:ribosome recycling factor
MAQATMAANPALKDTYLQLKARMDKAVEDFRREMAATRTGRASVHMMDTVRVDYYGELMPLNQIATVHAPEPHIFIGSSKITAPPSAISGATAMTPSRRP